MKEFDFVLYFGLAVIFIGISLLGFILHFFLLNKKVKFWNKARGRVLTSDLIKEKDFYLYDSDNPTAPDTQESYSLKIEYNYRFNGKIYKSDRIFGSVFMKFFLSKSKMKKIINKYPIDKEITVFVNPKNHNYAILKNEISIIDKIIIPVLIVLTGIIILFFKSELSLFFS